MEQALIKSRERVRERAEVFTAEREVTAMLDLLPLQFDEEYAYKTTFLEPACGNGNFLIEILRRKLRAVGATPGEDLAAAARAAASMYGIDICPENVAEARARLYLFALTGEDALPHLNPERQQSDALFAYLDRLPQVQHVHPHFRWLLSVILESNITQGDFLKCEDSEGKPLRVCKWSFDAHTAWATWFLLSDIQAGAPKPLWSELVTWR